MTVDGLRCGIQIVDERHRDDLVLQAAHAYEQYGRGTPAVLNCDGTSLNLDAGAAATGRDDVMPDVGPVRS